MQRSRRLHAERRHDDADADTFHREVTVGPRHVSVAGFTPLIARTGYSASKHAVKGYVDSLRLELMHEKAPVSVTLIQPSGINTPFVDKALNTSRFMGLIAALLPQAPVIWLRRDLRLSDHLPLAAALRQGINLPYGCKDGACGSCKVALIEGEADHQDVYLTDSEKRANLAAPLIQDNPNIFEMRAQLFW